MSEQHGNNSIHADAMEFFGGRARLVACSPVSDQRGSLLPFIFADMPFVPCRAFAVTGAHIGALRGGHAHRSGSQLLYCLHGRIQVTMRVAKEEESLVLAPGGSGLLFGHGVWCQQEYLKAGAVLLVFASEPYDPSSYVDEMS